MNLLLIQRLTYLNKIFQKKQMQLLESEKKEKYNPDNLYKKTIKSENIDKEFGNMELVEYKENFFTKFKNFVLKLLHLNN